MYQSACTAPASPPCLYVYSYRPYRALYSCICERDRERATAPHTSYGMSYMCVWPTRPFPLGVTYFHATGFAQPAARFAQPSVNLSRSLPRLCNPASPADDSAHDPVLVL